MRSALISPYSVSPLRGNIVTVSRIERHLREAGVEPLVLAADTLTPTRMARLLDKFAPDVIHAFHAARCGPLARDLAGRLHLPFLITITGTDLHDPQLRDRPDTLQALRSAAAVVCFTDADARLATGSFPVLRERVTLVPQGVEPLPVSGEETFGLAPGDFVVLLPAALRPVKGVEFALQAVAALSAAAPELRLVIAGGVLHREYAAAVETLVRDTPNAVWLGEVPYGRMGGLYRRADLVLNCSRSEAMSNSLMEAMALGRPVLVADIPGNRSLVQDGETGWIFTDEADFQRQLLRIMGNAPLRAACGERAGEHLRTHFSPIREAERYRALYHRICSRINSEAPPHCSSPPPPPPITDGC